MIEWFVQQAVDIIKGMLGVLIGSWIFFKYLLPKISRDMAISTADAILNHPKIKKTSEELQKLVDKAKELDFQELIDMAKGLKVFIELQTNKTPPPPPPKTQKDSNKISN